eukprot:GHVP01069781.1.p1 GENE.GHVP01069781.1~~GHVP01069781.1.p1  ORF type:complete len:393 (-),score=51.70 GHVP01069781.1:386-1564(-)
MCSNSVLQFESGWALTNIASGTSSQTQAVVEVGGVLGFLNLLRSRESPLQEQGLWGIGNVAGDRLEYRDLLLDSDVCVSLIVSIFQDLLLGKNFPNDTNVLRTAVFCVSNLCRGKPRPKFDRTSPFLPFLAQILDLETADEALLADVLWALEGMTESTKSIDLLIEHCVPQKAVRLMQQEDMLPSVSRAALRLVGQVATGTECQTNTVIQNGVLPVLKRLLQSKKKSVRKDSCWIISNITAGPPSHIARVLELNILEELFKIFRLDVEADVRKEAAWAIANVSTTSCGIQVESLLREGCLVCLCEMLKLEDPIMLSVVLDGLENFLKIGFTQSRCSVNLVKDLMTHLDGWNLLLKLYSASGCNGNYHVWQKTSQMLEVYFPNALSAQLSKSF